MEYLNIISYERCCGCGACKNVCPQGAITMNEDSEGFIFPYIDREKCTNCGLCKKTCPVLTVKFNEAPVNCFAVMAEDAIRQKSSSGGMFGLIAEYVIKKGGFVCGAAFDKDWNVEHIIVDNLTDLEKLRGSKYVQSNIGNIYNEVKKLLNLGRLVFFTGTPCQVAGLNGVLQKDYDNLLTLDIVCHGVPNNRTWQKFLNSNFDKRNIKKVNFRDRSRIGWSCDTVITMNDESAINNQSYFDGFCQNLYLRKSCTSCNFAKNKRCADLTIGDFWQVEQLDKKMNDSKGTSLVLLNTKKAEIYFRKLKYSFKKCKKFKASKYLKISQNFPLYRSSIVHRNRDKFFKGFNNVDNFNEYVYKILSEPYDNAIMGVWYGGNYGGVLTMFALYSFLKKHGLSSILINNCSMIENDWFSYGQKLVSDFIKKYSIDYTDKIYHFSQLYDLNNIANNFIIASDQTWNYVISPNCYENFFFDFVHSNKNKISCAASFGHYTSNSPEYKHKEISYYLKKFDGISVREDSALKILENEFDVRNGKHILDPVFYDREIYEELVANSTVTENEPYIFSYCMDPTDDKENILEYVSEQLNKKVNVVADISPLSHNHVITKFKKFTPVDASYEDWVKYVKNSDFVIADSFHGICFSIIYKKNFIAIANKGRGLTRFESLLKMLNLENRLVFDFNDVLNKKELLEDIDYDKVYEIIDKKRIESVEWLFEKLNTKNQNSFSDFDINLINKKSDIENLCNQSEHFLLMLKCLKNQHKYFLKYYFYKIMCNFTFKNLRIVRVIRSINCDCRNILDLTLSKQAEIRMNLERVRENKFLNRI